MFHIFIISVSALNVAIRVLGGVHVIKSHCEWVEIEIF